MSKSLAHSLVVRIAGAGLALLVGPFALAIDDPAWVGYQANNGHTGFVDRSIVFPQSIHTRWQYTSTQSVGALTVGAGRVFVPEGYYFGAGLQLQALDMDTGLISWERDFGSIFSVGQAAYDPVTRQVFVQTCNNSPGTFLRAYDAATGDFKWRTEFYAQWENYKSPVVMGGNVYIDGGSYGGLLKFDAISGAMLWFTGLPQYDQWAPTPWVNGKVLTYTNSLAIVDTTTGAVQGTIQDAGYVWGGYSVGQAPVLTAPNVAMVTNGGRLVAYDLLNKTASASALGVDGQLSFDGKDLFAITAGALTDRDPATGALRWAWEPPSGSLLASVIVFREHVVVAGSAGTFLIDRRTRAATQLLSTYGNMAYADDTLLVGESSGRVTAISLISTPYFLDGFE